MFVKKTRITLKLKITIISKYTKYKDNSVASVELFLLSVLCAFWAIPFAFWFGQQADTSEMEPFDGALQKKKFEYMAIIVIIMTSCNLRKVIMITQKLTSVLSHPIISPYDT